MGWHHRDEDWRADHDRDMRDDPIPLRFQPKPLSTAHDVAIIVRNLKNLDDAAALIERYADAKAAEGRLEAIAAGARP